MAFEHKTVYYVVLSCILLFAVLRTAACQAPLSMGFSGKENWSGLPFPSLGDLPDSGIEPTSPPAPALQVDSLPLSHQLVKIYLPAAQGAP